LLSIALLAAALVTASAAVPAHATPAWFSLKGKVTRVIDGDTLQVKIGKRTERVRLIGIDAPETSACYAGEATRAARLLASGKRVRLVGDRTQTRRDRFGRRLAYLTLPNGQDLGSRLLAGGYAAVFVFERRFARFARYSRAEADARTARRGMWTACAVEPPPTADLVLTNVDAPDPVIVGSNLLYTLTIANVGPATAEGVRVRDEFSSPVSIVTATTSVNGGCTGQPSGAGTLLECSLTDPLVTTAGATITIVVRPGVAGTLTSTATVTATTPDSSAASNTAIATTTVTSAAPPPPPPPQNCHASYPTVCIPPAPPDLDCGQISHRNFTVRHDVPDPDPHRFDGDRDGIGCES
jgi:uncharacterized repeat protein (TIGR01451 family)